MTDIDQAGPTVRGLRALYAAGHATPAQVLEETRAQIARTNPVLNAHWHALDEIATVAADESTVRWRNGTPRPLEGIPIGVKDVVDVAGAPCTGGSRIYRNRTAIRDATVVKRLHAAGAVPVTKDATTEFGIGGPLNPLYGPTRNPWSPAHWTGGSSCGAAAGLAAGTVPLAIGTDAGGSVRIPASWSGTVGLKPTMGRVSRAGVMPCSWHAEVVGPMARTVSDAYALLTVISGPDPDDPRTETTDLESTLGDVPPAALRVGVAPGWWDGIADDPTTQAVHDAVDALRSAGVHIVAVTGLPPARELHDLSYEIVWVESFAHHKAHRDYRDLMDPVGADRLAAGENVTAADYFELLRRRTSAQRCMYDALASVDVLLTPTTPTSAPRFDDLTLTVGADSVPVHAGYGLLTAHANLTGFPALSIPTGFTTDGLPLSVQLTARPWNEVACCRVGRVLEHAFWPAAVPDLADVRFNSVVTIDTPAMESTELTVGETSYLLNQLDEGGVDSFLTRCL